MEIAQAVTLWYIMLVTVLIADLSLWKWLPATSKDVGDVEVLARLLLGKLVVTYCQQLVNDCPQRLRKHPILYIAGHISNEF